MFAKCVISSVFGLIGLLSVSSAFAQTSPPNTVKYEDRTIFIFNLTSIGVETPLTSAGAQSAPVHQIVGEASIGPKCQTNPCFGMPKPEETTLIFKSVVMDKTPSSQRLFGLCRRAIESAHDKDTIVLTGSFAERTSGGPSTRELEFTSLTDCAVERPVPVEDTFRN